MVKILGKTKAVTSDFQRADGLLKGFLVILTDTHGLPDRAHLGPQLIFHTRKLLKGPSGKFDDYIVA